jgi:uncharacterized protein
MIFRVLGILGATIFISCAATEQSLAQQPSFSCRGVTGLDEIAICQNPVLARLDRQLQGIFDAAMDRLNRSDQVLLRETERRWLQRRANCGTNVDCLENQYQVRIGQLGATLSGQ